ncbi:cold shock small protein YmcF [Symbiopectobacterium purcellii]|uniref:cold shock small protein YmcF n=1 Tax=Symbiopectobacterium purcellii TaxID=2871826 RepID=UPI003F84D82C
MSTLFLKCPCCHGSQYRTSHFDVSPWNPHGAKCIFCKSIMQVESNSAVHTGQLIKMPTLLAHYS